MPQHPSSGTCRRNRTWMEKRMHRESFSAFTDLRDRRLGVKSPHTLDFERDPVQKEAAREIRTLAKQRKWEEALEIFSTFQDPDPILCTATMDACAKSMKLYHTRRILAEMTINHLPAYNVLINLLGRLKRVQEAEELLQRMKEDTVEPNDVSLCSLINGHGMVQDSAAVFRVLEQIKASGPVSSVCYSAAVSACARAGDAERVLEVFRMMEEDGIQPPAALYSSLILARARKGDEEGARAALADMRQRGHRPDVIAYTSLMIAFYGKPGVLEKSDALFAEMLGEGIVPDVFAFNALLFSAWEAKNSTRFREILADMASRGVPHNRETEKRIQDLQELEEEQRLLAPPLPEGWEERVDPASGHAYYWMTRDPAGTTTWQRPS